MAAATTAKIWCLLCYFWNICLRLWVVGPVMCIVAWWIFAHLRTEIVTQQTDSEENARIARLSRWKREGSSGSLQQEVKQMTQTWIEQLQSSQQSSLHHAKSLDPRTRPGRRQHQLLYKLQLLAPYSVYMKRVGSINICFSSPLPLFQFAVE